MSTNPHHAHELLAQAANRLATLSRQLGVPTADVHSALDTAFGAASGSSAV
ncbi:MAG: hypothetical protein FWF43_05155 [Propionibacteriaceae bacterium]|nr:hypothetical protein [Propionibacteriaceae bacterium]